MLHETLPRSRRAEVRRRAIRLLVPFLLLGLFAAGPLQAQPDPNPVTLTAPDTLFHEQWTVEDGLPVNHANALHQTPDGYIWLATFDGLVRFDGLRFTVYNASNTPALPSSRIGTIRPGRGTSFWITTVQGHLLRWTSGARSETFDVRADPLYATYVDGDSLTWLAGRRGLFRYRAGHVTAAFEDQLDSRWITDVRRDRHGTLWVADRSGGTWRAEGERLTPATPPAGLSLTTSSSAYYRQSRASRCPDGTWVRGGGNTIEWEGRPVSFGHGQDGITDLLCDQAGSLWVTTRRSGLHRYGLPPLRSYGGREGLGLRNVYSVYEDPAGARWFTGRGGRISRLNDGVIRHYVEGTHFAESTGPVAHDSDQAMIEDQDGRLWLGFQVCRPADRTAEGRCTRFDWAAGAPQKNGVYAIHQTTDGPLWFGTTHGLYRLHGDEWSRFTTADGLADDHVRFLLEARDGTLYAATLRGGVLRYRNGIFTAITAADGLPSNHVRALYEDDDGFLWVGTEDRGLARYDPATGTLATIHQADGLYYDGIHQILEDEAGRLWMSTNRGLFWVRRAALNAFIRGAAEQVTSVYYTERDGIRHREANGGRQQSALKASDGRLWFATQEGAVVVDPADVPRDTPSPQPIIEQVTADGAPRAARTDGSIALAAEQRSFTIAYTAPAFAAPERVRFRYQLDGFDDGWVDAGPRREATYTNVPPGPYTFRVAALRPGGEWIEGGTSFRITVAPFFYETRWFLGLCGAAFGLVLLGGYRVRTRHLHRRQEKLQATVDEQTRALRTEKDRLRHEKQKTEQQAERLREMDRLKSRFFANVSHEFRTPLTLIMGPLEDLQSGEAPPLPAVAQEKVDVALRNSRRLHRLIGQLLDVAKLESGALRLDTERADLVAFVRRLAQSFVPLAERRNVRFTVDVPNAPLPACFDLEKMEQVLANLLSNAFKFTSEGGVVRVTLAPDTSRAEPAACLTVCDSGPGIPPEDVPHLFERFYQVRAPRVEGQPGTGIGLSLAKDLTELHGGSITVESTVGVGTTFTVRLPRKTVSHAHPPEGAALITMLLAPGPSQSGTGRLESGGPERASRAREDDEGASVADDRTTLLIADDNTELRAYVRNHFEPHYRVLEATNGRAALETARTALPDLIISDVMMPHLDGFELVQALQGSRETDFLPVLLLTARATDEDTIRGIRKGADAYLTKPFNMRELQARVKNIIASRQRLKERFAVTPVDEASLASDSTASLTPTEAAYVERVRAAVKANLSDEAFGVEELAAVLDQSRSTLYRRLRDMIDQSPSAYIRNVRLEQGAALLRDDEGTVSEVAYAVGFKSVSHFSQTFRDRYDVTPSEYSDAIPQ